MVHANASDDCLLLKARGDWRSGFEIAVLAERSVTVDRLVLLEWRDGALFGVSVLAEDFALGAGERRDFRSGVETPLVAFRLSYRVGGDERALRLDFSR